MDLEVPWYYFPSIMMMLRWFCRTGFQSMTCSWCDKRIPLVRLLSGSGYCCEEHQKEEAKNLRQIAIQRLRNTPAFQELEKRPLIVNQFGDAGSCAAAEQGITVSEFEPARA